MSFKDYLKAATIIDGQLIIDFSYPQSNEKVQEVEDILQIKLPSSYKDFLKRYGSIGFKGEEIYGLTYNYNYTQYIYCNIVCATLEERKINQSPSFPKSLIPIHALGNGELSCLDTSQMNAEGECQVVAWYFGKTLPNGKFEILAEDFGAFLLEKVIRGLESLEEDGLKVDWLGIKK